MFRVIGILLYTRLPWRSETNGRHPFGHRPSSYLFSPHPRGTSGFSAPPRPVAGLGWHGACAPTLDVSNKSILYTPLPPSASPFSFPCKNHPAPLPFSHPFPRGRDARAPSIHPRPIRSPVAARLGRRSLKSSPSCLPPSALQALSCPRSGFLGFQWRHPSRLLPSLFVPFVAEIPLASLPHAIRKGAAGCR